MITSDASRLNKADLIHVTLRRRVEFSRGAAEGPRMDLFTKCRATFFSFRKEMRPHLLKSLL